MGIYISWRKVEKREKFLGEFGSVEVNQISTAQGISGFETHSVSHRGGCRRKSSFKAC